MTAPQQNLHVLTEHIGELADKQARAADQFTGANRSAGDVAPRVLATHGLACAATSAALSVTDGARNTAGVQLMKRSNDLASKLSTAAANYSNTDYLAGRNIGRECQM
ncbi:ESX-1 secretion-associated protein [Mycobacterium sp. ITM-2016-00317]|uniref:ESX-1 secretion-associated protein n=1 Tax=Mycobacterium sp. ITM-2016-00317 TaxID=2099694 RepID=UPI000D4621FB|nr:ESX-1 secretion-associated protein [Mycobacterium sp. ITM-2016-00317]WNG87370.1 ESX-1 secretion-associated protein [Mycobacterium sp. ITM-2016-00317]